MKLLISSNGDQITVRNSYKVSARMNRLVNRFVAQDCFYDTSEESGETASPVKQVNDFIAFHVAEVEFSVQ